MNTYYKKTLSALLLISTTVTYAKNRHENKMSPEDTTIALQFAPITPQPFSDSEDDRYLAGLLTKIIKIDEEIDNNPRLKLTSKRPMSSISEFVAENKNIHTIVSQSKSFGWNDPLAIASAMIYNGAAITPNELVITIEESTEFLGKYKAKIVGRGLYADKKDAHSQLASYIKTGPQNISKYAKLEEITTLQDLCDQRTASFKKSEKEKLQQLTPSLQGHVKCDCYFHGCDVNGVIYFNEATLIYLLQSMNGNRHLENTCKPKNTPIEKQLTPEKIIPVKTETPVCHTTNPISTKSIYDISAQEKERIKALIQALQVQEENSLNNSSDQKSDDKNPNS